MSAFTCTASSTRSPHYCERIYDGTGSWWQTQRGQGRNAWINIQFNRRIILSRVDLQRMPDNGWFKKVQLSFSNGRSQTATLAPDKEWTNIVISPVVDTTYIKIKALDHYQSEQLNSWAYGLTEMRLYTGAILIGRYK